MPPRPLSALGSTRESVAGCYLSQDPVPLFKGKSMPSLRYVVGPSFLTPFSISRRGVLNLAAIH